MALQQINYLVRIYSSADLQWCGFTAVRISIDSPYIPFHVEFKAIEFKLFGAILSYFGPQHIFSCSFKFPLAFFATLRTVYWLSSMVKQVHWHAIKEQQQSFQKNAFL
jgi:hypothetical protein